MKILIPIYLLFLGLGTVAMDLPSALNFEDGVENERRLLALMKQYNGLIPWHLTRHALDDLANSEDINLIVDSSGAKKKFYRVGSESEFKQNMPGISLSANFGTSTHKAELILEKAEPINNWLYLTYRFKQGRMATFGWGTAYQTLQIKTQMPTNFTLSNLSESGFYDIETQTTIPFEFFEEEYAREETENQSFVGALSESQLDYSVSFSQTPAILLSQRPKKAPPAERPVPVQALPANTKYTHFVNLSRYPNMSIPIPKGYNQATLGDLHGHASKFLQASELLGVSAIDPQDFLALHDQIVSLENATVEKVDNFELLLKKVKFNKSILEKFLLGGDETADRGPSDIPTYMIMGAATDAGVPLESIISNHSVDALKVYFADFNLSVSDLCRKSPRNPFQHLQGVSQINMVESFVGQPALKAKIKKLITEKYLPIIRALAFTLDHKNNTISIFSHAPIPLWVIKAIAGVLGVKYDDTTIDAMANTIIEINKVFLDKVIHTGKVHDYFMTGNHKTNPFHLLVWNREVRDQDRPSEHNGYRINWVHGHDGSIRDFRSHIFNLDADNNLGKGGPNMEGKMLYKNEGNLHILFSVNDKN